MAYMLAMCVVLVSWMINVTIYGWETPGAMIFIAIILAYVISALLHPKEARCLWCLLVYIMLLPSCTMLLVIYACYNLHDVSWGTRELPPKPKKTREV